MPLPIACVGKKEERRAEERRIKCGRGHEVLHFDDAAAES